MTTNEIDQLREDLITNLRLNASEDLRRRKEKGIGEIEDPTGGAWDECIHSYEEPKPPSKWWARAAYILLVVSSFLLGRAYGWYEVHVYMKHLAEGLGVIAGSLK